MFANAIGDSFGQGCIIMMMLVAAAIHFGNKVNKANREFGQEANNALKGGILKLIRRFIK